MGCALLCGALLGACSDGDEQIIEEQPRPEVPYLNVYSASFDEAGADGTTFRATVESNRTVEVESSAEWCEAELKADTEQNNLEITVYANPDEKGRQATVTVRAAECEPVEIAISQQERKPGPFLTVSTREFTDVPVEGATLKTTLTTNRGGVQVSSDAKWCVVSYNPTLKTDNITLTVAPQRGREPHGDRHRSGRRVRARRNRRHAARTARRRMRTALLRDRTREEPQSYENNRIPVRH